MIAVAIVMACGLTVLIMARGLIHTLESTLDSYYGTNRFADVFSDLKRAPMSVRPALAAIPDVAVVETRVKGAAILDIPGLNESADAIVLSIPDERRQQLNLLHMRSGRLPERGSRGEVVVSEAFAQSHGFTPTDTIDATIYGVRQRLRIAGIALSPEFVIELPPGTVIPDHRLHGVFWMNERELATALDMDGAFNNVAIDVAPGGNVRAVKAEVDRILAPYGGLIAIDRTEHPSAKQVVDEIRGLQAFAIAFPVVFLSIAAFMTSAALTRLVGLQREQIAQLKAFGYSSFSIGVHYFEFALVVVVVAIVAGGAAGLWMGKGVVGLYHQFFKFPTLVFQPDWPAAMVGLLASSATSFVGVFSAVRKAVNLAPAEAMRPEPPASFKPSVIERLGFQNLVPAAFRMALRNIERKPFQAFFTTLGLSLATAITIVPGAMGAGVEHLMDFQWRLAQRQDATVSLIEPSSHRALDDVRHLPGVLSVEPYRSVPSRITFGHQARRVGVTGLPEKTELNRLLNIDGVQVPMPAAGLLLSAKLAEVLGVVPGDSVRVEVQEGRRPVLDLVVAGTITDYSGVGAYMDIDALRRMMGEGGTISGAHLALDMAEWEALVERVKETPRIGSLTRTLAARESFENQMGEMMGIMQSFFLIFAMVVAFGVIYNGTRIALSERTRDLATLRVLGFTEREVASVLIGELGLLTLLAIAPGLAIGAKLSELMIENANTETVRIPLVLTNETYTIAVLVVLISSGLSFLVVGRQIRKLDLLGVLKAGE